VSRWRLWQQRRRVIVYCLACEAAVVAGAIALMGATSFAPRDVLIFSALVGLGVLQAELSRSVERLRRRISRVAHINMTSVWTVAGVLLLPAVLTAALVALLYWHLALRSWYRLQRVPWWRTVSNATMVALTCWSAHAALAFAGVDGISDAIERGWQGAAVVGVVIVVYFVIGGLIVLPASDDMARTLRGLVGGWTENALELATLCLGVLTALALAVTPWLALLMASSFAAYGAVKKYVDLDGMQSLTVETLVMFLPALGYVLFLEFSGVGTAASVSPAHTALLVGGGFVTALPLLMFGVAARRLPLSVIGMLQYIAPTLMFFIGWLVQGEEMPPARWAGFALVWLALSVFAFDQVRDARARSVRRRSEQAERPTPESCD
jgi:uncharacterized membrane protein